MAEACIFHPIVEELPAVSSEYGRLRASDPKQYLERSLDSIAAHVGAMLELQRRGAVTFDYGNNIRRMAADRGVSNAFDIPGFVPEYIRPLFAEGRGPFRWVALSGEPADIAATDEHDDRLIPSPAERHIARSRIDDRPAGPLGPPLARPP